MKENQKAITLTLSPEIIETILVIVKNTSLNMLNTSPLNFANMASYMAIFSLNAENALKAFTEQNKEELSSTVENPQENEEEKTA